MQERVLGSLIMGGIALIGIVWGCIEGIAPLSDAKKDEAVLETSLKETIKDYLYNNKIDLKKKFYDVDFKY